MPTPARRQQKPESSFDSSFFARPLCPRASDMAGVMELLRDKLGRPPIGKHPMTAAARPRRHRREQAPRLRESPRLLRGHHHASLEAPNASLQCLTRLVAALRDCPPCARALAALRGSYVARLLRKRAVFIGSLRSWRVVLPVARAWVEHAERTIRAGHELNPMRSALI